jgi:hypothetical protein
LDIGAVTCADPEELQVILKTLSANAFNFAKSDVGVGIHTIKVEARASAAVSFDDTSGALAGRTGVHRRGSLLVEEIRLVKDTNIIVDIQ